MLGQIYQCHGEPARAIAYYKEALALAEEAEEPQLLFSCYDGLATHAKSPGGLRAGRARARRARGVAVPGLTRTRLE